jgi:hypothetical protein
MVAAGRRLSTLNFEEAVGDVQDDAFSFDSTTFGVDADSGTYVTCGTDFVAPASGPDGSTGTVLLLYAANLDNGTGTAATNLAPVVRTGATVGSGSTILAASLNICIRNIGTDDRRYGAHYLLEGLTPGSAYNVRLEHRVSGGTGTIQYRDVAVVPVN